MKGPIKKLITAIVILVVIVVLIYFGYSIHEAIQSSSAPDWLKWLFR